MSLPIIVLAMLIMGLAALFRNSIPLTGTYELRQPKLGYLGMISIGCVLLVLGDTVYSIFQWDRTSNNVRGAVDFLIQFLVYMGAAATIVLAFFLKEPREVVPSETGAQASKAMRLFKVGAMTLLICLAILVFILVFAFVLLLSL